jgi:nucleoside-diphosphate-sugar epimerase
MFRDLQGKHVFITGITSPVGREIAVLLLEAGASVSGLVRNAARGVPLPENVDIVGGDCARAGDYRKSVRASSFVVHAAGLHLSSEVIRSCAGHDQLERIAFISSMRVKYPDHLLARKEKAGKRVLLQKEDEISTSLLPWTILRPTLIYSSGDRSLSKVRRFMAARRLFPVPGSGDAIRQPISARDLAVSIVKALRSPSAHQRKYCLPGEKISVRKILQIMSEEMGLNVKLIGVPESPVKMITKMCEVFRARRLEAALMSFARWYHGFDWPGGPAAEDFGHSPRSFRQNVREQIAGEGWTRDSD